MLRNGCVLIIAGTLTCMGCNKSDNVNKSAELATVGGKAITVGQLEKEVQSFTGGRPQNMYPGSYEITLNRMVDLMLVEAEASKRNLTASKEYNEAIDAIRVRLAREEREMLYRLLQEDVNKKTEVSDDEIKNYYQQVKNRFLTTSLHLRRIEVDDGKVAQEIRKKLAAKKDFLQLAEQYNTDPELKRNKGDMGVLYREDIPVELRSAVYSLRDVNSVSQPVFARGKWIILQLVKQEVNVERPYESIKPLLEKELQRKKSIEAMQKILADNRKELKVEINKTELGKLIAARQAQYQTKQPQMTGSSTAILHSAPMPDKTASAISGQNNQPPGVAQVSSGKPLTVSGPQPVQDPGITKSK